MTVIAQERIAATDSSAATRGSSVRILETFVIVMLVIPSDIVIRAAGGATFPAGLVGMFAFVFWVAATLFGLNHRLRRNPVRNVLAAFWMVSLISYALIDRSAFGPHELQGADRFMMDLAILTGIALVATDGLASLVDVRRVVRAMCWGASFGGVVASLQFWANLDITPYLRVLPGFTQVSSHMAITARDALNRVAGIAIHPIELATVSAMLLPLAIWLAIHDVDRSSIKRWAPVALIGISAMVSVSRSAILCLAVVVVVMVLAMPAYQRLVALCVMPFALAGVFLIAHGLIRTLLTLLGLGTSDPSIQNRVNNFPYVQHLVSSAPWFGHGVGTYIATSATHIFDNQYLTSAVESGVLGVVGLLALFLVPVAAVLNARAASGDPELRLLCAATAASLLAATVASATFDSFSFNMFFATLSIVLGLAGAAWALVLDERRADAVDGLPTARSEPRIGRLSGRWIPAAQTRGA